MSFNGNKIITTGGGGAIVTNDAKVAKQRSISPPSKSSHPWKYFHDKVGYNYRMPNINAALGCAQLPKIEKFISKKRTLFEEYNKSFAAVEGVVMLSEPPNARSNFWLQAIVLEDDVTHLRDSIIEALNAAGFMARPVWELLSQLPPYLKCQTADLSISKKVSQKITISRVVRRWLFETG